MIRMNGFFAAGILNDIEMGVQDGECLFRIVPSETKITGDIDRIKTLPTSTYTLREVLEGMDKRVKEYLPENGGDDHFSDDLGNYFASRLLASLFCVQNTKLDRHQGEELTKLFLFSVGYYDLWDSSSDRFERLEMAKCLCNGHTEIPQIIKYLVK